MQYLYDDDVEVDCVGLLFMQKLCDIVDDVAGKLLLNLLVSLAITSAAEETAVEYQK